MITNNYIQTLKHGPTCWIHNVAFIGFPRQFRWLTFFSCTEARCTGLEGRPVTEFCFLHCENPGVGNECDTFIVAKIHHCIFQVTHLQPIKNNPKVHTKYKPCNGICLWQANNPYFRTGYRSLKVTNQKYSNKLLTCLMGGTKQFLPCRTLTTPLSYDDLTAAHPNGCFLDICIK